MGYSDITHYRLKFEERAGLEVVAEGLTTGEILDLGDLTSQLGDDPSKVKVDATTRPVIEKLMEVLAGALIEWNIEDRQGHPVPMTVDGLKTLKLALVMDIVTEWMNAQVEVDDDLGKGSPSGGTSDLAQSLPMAELSPSRGS